MMYTHTHPTHARGGATAAVSVFIPDALAAVVARILSAFVIVCPNNTSHCTRDAIPILQPFDDRIFHEYWQSLELDRFFARHDVFSGCSCTFLAA